MGNLFSREEDLSTAAIEEMYATRAAGAWASVQQAASVTQQEAFKDNINEAASDPNNDLLDSETTVAEASQARNPFDLQPNNSMAIQRTAQALRGSVSQDLAVSAACYITIAVRAYHAKAADAFDHAIAKLKEMGIINVAKVIGHWVKAHPWETAALVVPLILVACTPAILGGIGFSAGGIVAGSIAAGIQAGIGNVVAGSAFAVLTSAMMGGGGLAVVLGGVWGISTAIVGGIALWKRWFGTESENDSTVHSAYAAIEDNDNDNDNDNDPDDDERQKRIKED